MNTTHPQSSNSFAKLKSSILYLCERQDSASALLDSVQLNKMLWYADTEAFLAAGRSITGSRYVRKPRGPVAKFAPAAIKGLVSGAFLTVGKRHDDVNGIWLDTYEVSHIGGGRVVDDDDEIDADDLIDLSDAERGFLDRAFKRASLEHGSKSISERTHAEIWSLAVDGEEIPLHVIYAERLGKITATHIQHAFPPNE
jgi:hypothetical protein